MSSFPLCHCLVDGVWHCSIRAEGARGRNLCSGSVSRFRDLYLPEQFQAASCPCVRFLLVSFPRFVCGQWRKSTQKHRRQSFIGWQRVCACVYVNSISFVWMGCLFGDDEEGFTVCQWHSRPGTRWRSIHLLNTIVFKEWHWDNGADCTARRKTCILLHKCLIPLVTQRWQLLE